MKSWKINWDIRGIKSIEARKEKTMKRLGLILTLAVLIFSSAVSLAGAYEEHMLSMDFKAEKKPQHRLARVKDAKDSCYNVLGGAILYDTDYPHRQIGYVHEGCLVDCLLDISKGTEDDEPYRTRVYICGVYGLIEKNRLDFELEKGFKDKQSFFALHDEKILLDFGKNRKKSSGTLIKNEACTLLFEYWNDETREKYCLVETENAYGFVPSDALSRKPER